MMYTILSLSLDRFQPQVQIWLLPSHETPRTTHLICRVPVWSSVNWYNIEIPQNSAKNNAHFKITQTVLGSIKLRQIRRWISYCFPMQPLGPSENGWAAFLKSLSYSFPIHLSGIKLSQSLKFFSLWDAAQLPTDTAVYSCVNLDY